LWKAKEELTTKLVDELFRRFKEVSVVLNAQGQIIESQEMLQDLKLDQIATLNSKIKEKWE
jgi:hypothetical protein